MDLFINKIVSRILQIILCLINYGYDKGNCGK